MSRSVICRICYTYLHGLRWSFAFWPISTDKQALKNLRTLFTRLRHGLPDADLFLDFTPQSIQWRLDASLVLDVADLEIAAE